MANGRWRMADGFGVMIHVYVARKNGYIGYIVVNQQLKRLHNRLQKVTSVTLLIGNDLRLKKSCFNDTIISGGKRMEEPNLGLARWRMEHGGDIWEALLGDTGLYCTGSGEWMNGLMGTLAAQQRRPTGGRVGLGRICLRFAMARQFEHGDLFCFSMGLFGVV